MKKNLFLLPLTLLMFSCKQGPPVQNSYEIPSPDGKITAGFFMDLEGHLAYSVSYNQAQVIFPSRLALDLDDGGLIGENMQLLRTEEEVVDETYPVYAGKSSSARNHYHQMKFFLVEKEGRQRKLNLEFRVFDDGVAFRYEVPDQDAMTRYDLRAEHTQFHLCQAATIWPLFVPSFTTPYEFLYKKTIPDSITMDKLVALPLSFRIHEKLAGSITEANLGNFPGMYITRDTDTPPTLEARLSPVPGTPDICMRSGSGFVTPWRVIMVAEKLVDLIPSNLVMNLNEPCRIEDPSWIRPGKVAWDWWSGQVVEQDSIEAGMNNATMEYYIDFAAEFDLSYMLIDAGWYGDHADAEADVTRSIPEIDIPALVKYAGAKGVNIILWLNWKAFLPRMEEAFSRYESWGVKGVKIDYMNRDDQEMVAFYREATEMAAKHHLLVDFHGAFKPDGIRRTWPNLLTREGVLGLEHLKWSNVPGPPHNVTLPFTRMLAGPMDYTPGGFRQVTREVFRPEYRNPLVLGTRCHQLAMYVVFESPLQMLSDHPDAYRGQQGAAFLKEVPASWDETRALAGKIGEYVVLGQEERGPVVPGSHDQLGCTADKLCARLPG